MTFETTHPLHRRAGVHGRTGPFDTCLDPRTTTAFDPTLREGPGHSNSGPVESPGSAILRDERPGVSHWVEHIAVPGATRWIESSKGTNQVETSRPSWCEGVQRMGWTPFISGQARSPSTSQAYAISSSRDAPTHRCSASRSGLPGQTQRVRPALPGRGAHQRPARARLTIMSDPERFGPVGPRPGPSRTRPLQTLLLPRVVLAPRRNEGLTTLVLALGWGTLSFEATRPASEAGRWREREVQLFGGPRP